MINNIKYSIIIPYRDRKSHLTTIIPALHKKFKDSEYEIIIVQQNDKLPFKRGYLRNEGAKLSTGNILVFHDVDYVPTDSVIYWPEEIASVISFRPVVKTVFRNDINTEDKDINEVPCGYRSFVDGIDDDFFGGVISIRREFFMSSVNGYHPLYAGWGLEDADLRIRVENAAKLLNISTPIHSANQIYSHEPTVGIFQVLDHADSFPGIEDPWFQNNQKLFFDRTASHYSYGVKTQKCTVTHNDILKKEFELRDVDIWVDVCNMEVELNEDLIQFYHMTKMCNMGVTISNENASPSTNSSYKHMTTQWNHPYIWNSLTKITDATPYLKSHRDWVEMFNWGYGNRPFHAMWDSIIRDMPYGFKFLEIGVFKGQILSLVCMLNTIHDKKSTGIYGITPLSSSGDKYGTHPQSDYAKDIEMIFEANNIDGSPCSILQGFSTDNDIIQKAQKYGPYDVIYIDGCHDYDVVKSDLEVYKDMVVDGGWIVVDDASCDLPIPDGLIPLNWRGLPDVTTATIEVLESDPDYVLWYVVGHNKVFRKNESI